MTLQEFINAVGLHGALRQLGPELNRRMNLPDIRGLMDLSQFGTMCRVKGVTTAVQLNPQEDGDFILDAIARHKLRMLSMPDPTPAFDPARSP